MAGMREKAVQGIKAGDEFTITRTFSAADTIAFGELTRDYNPVHYDEAFAQGKGLAGLINHGLLTGSMICEIGGQIAWLASGMEFRFRRPVYFGDTVTCRLVITEVGAKGRAKAEATYTNQRGEVVVSARISGRLPGPEDRKRLAEMIAKGDPTNPVPGVP
jgi:acyl dehydratase